MGLQSRFSCRFCRLCLAVAIAVLVSLPATSWGIIDRFQNVLSGFSPYDINVDGIWEFDVMERLALGTPHELAAADARLVIVMVEYRLLNPIPGSPISEVDLLQRLARFEGDLHAEGYATEFVRASLYAGLRHQDGRTVLALREFLKSVKASYPNLCGVILVGSFPEPMLVRRWMWPKTVDEAGMRIGGVSVAIGTEYLRIVPEIVSERSDLVLADLDGRWDSLYEMGAMNLESIVAKPTMTAGPDWYTDGRVLDFPYYDRTSLSFQDFFWIKDDNYVVISATTSGLRMQIFTAQLHPEMNASDKALTNPVARPDIFVSRINPLHVAVNPDPTFRDVSGKGFLAADGKPQAVTSATPIDLSMGAFWVRDEKLERRILVDYFDRDHTYRVGGDSYLPFRTAAVGKDLSAAGLNDMLTKASSDFVGTVVVENASLLDYMDWLMEPALYRGIIAHSNCWSSAFGSSYDRSALDVAVGGRPWRWKRQATTNTYEPSLADQGGTADLYLHRTIWENGILEGAGNRLYIHGGCQVNSPDGAATRPYSDELYGTFQNAEGVLFYLNGIALCSRAKVFYDVPRGFSEALGQTGRSCFGEGWKAYFEEESRDASLPAMVADNKRCYTWSVIGDWTARLRPANGLGIIGLEAGALTDYAIHPNEAWIDGWDFSSSLNEVEGTGDLNGDGKGDVILTSEWGMGVVSHNGTAWHAIAIHPKGALMGGWRCNPDDNTIEGTGDFDSDGKDEILVTSPWGIGILKLSGPGLTSSMTVPGGTLFGAWSYDVKSSIIRGIGDFNGDGKDDILMSGQPGIGMFTLQGSTLTPIMIQPDGASFGTWRYDRKGDVIEGIADFNGDGKDDVLMTSSWGIGMFTVQGSTLAPIMAQPKGTWFGGWLYNQDDNVVEGTGDLNGDGRDDLVVSSPWGIGVLKVQGSTLTTIMAQPQGTAFGGWRYNPDDNTVREVADFNGDGRDDLLVSSPWGIGILALAGSTLSSVDMAAYDDPIGKWYLTATDRLCGAVVLDGGLAGLLFKK